MTLAKFDSQSQVWVLIDKMESLDKLDARLVLTATITGFKHSFNLYVFHTWLGVSFEKLLYRVRLVL